MYYFLLLSLPPHLLFLQKIDAFLLQAVINCYARSDEEDKAVKAMSILRRMEEQYRSGNAEAQPNEIAYNSVLNACAYTFGDAKAIETAFKIACLVFDEIFTCCQKWGRKKLIKF